MKENLKTIHLKFETLFTWRHQMYKTIIVPTDFSNEESTIQSLKKAEKLSASGQIILLHVLESVPYLVS